MHVRHTELPETQGTDLKTLKSLAPFLWDYRGRVALALAALVAIVYGDHIIDFYLTNERGFSWLLRDGAIYKIC